MRRQTILPESSAAKFLPDLFAMLLALTCNGRDLLVGCARAACALVVLVAALCGGPLLAQNVSVGTATANNSALLHLESTSKGLLIPRLTQTQMLGVSSPATGNLIYNSSNTNFYYYTGAFWTPLAGQGWSLTGDAGTSPSTNFLGTKDSVDLVQKTDYSERMRVFAGGNVGITNVFNTAEELRFFEPSSTGNLFTGFKAGIQTANIHYTLPPSDGSNNQALTDSMGTLAWKTFASVGGSGSQSLWVRGNGSNALYADSSSDKAGGKESINAGFNNSTSAVYGTAWGENNTVSGAQAAIDGGANSTASGQSSDIAGGAWNRASGQGAQVAGGLNNSTSGAHGTVVNGDSNSISGQETVILNGADNGTVAATDNLIFGYNLTPSGSNQLIFFPPGPAETRCGIGTYAPTQAMDIVGNAKFSLALKPNGNGGNSGQYLLSAGSGSPPTWGTISIPTTNWGLSGNFGSNPATNFIGTTDSMSFSMRTNSTFRMRLRATGQLEINTSGSTNEFSSLLNTTTNEKAAVFANAAGNTSNQSIGLWGDVDNTSTSNTGTIGVLATGSGASSAGATNVALQISQGEFTVGRTTESPSVGTDVEGATTHTAWSAQGPSGVVQASLQTDLSTVSPVAGVYQNLGTITINNRYITSSSVILAGVVQKIDGGGNPTPKNSVYKVDVESRTAGSCVLRVGMIPFVTDPGTYQGSDYIRIGYAVINPAK